MTERAVMAELENMERRRNVKTEVGFQPVPKGMLLHHHLWSLK